MAKMMLWLSSLHHSVRELRQPHFSLSSPLSWAVYYSIAPVIQVGWRCPCRLKCSLPGWRHTHNAMRQKCLCQVHISGLNSRPWGKSLSDTLLAARVTRRRFCAWMCLWVFSFCLYEAFCPYSSVSLRRVSIDISVLRSTVLREYWHWQTKV